MQPYLGPALDRGGFWALLVVLIFVMVAMTTSITLSSGHWMVSTTRIFTSLTSQMPALRKVDLESHGMTSIAGLRALLHGMCSSILSSAGKSRLVTAGSLCWFRSVTSQSLIPLLQLRLRMILTLGMCSSSAPLMQAYSLILNCPVD